MDRERLRRIRNFQSTDWYPALAIRPLTILVMMVIADWRFLTPNRLTTIANLVKLGAAWVIAFEPDHAILAAVLLQVGVLADHLDGTMARYQRTFTKLGSFYDKTSDLATWFLISLAFGWSAYRSTGQACYLAVAWAGSFSLDLRGYMKWLLVAESERVRWLEAARDPAVVIARHTAPLQVSEPPVRDAAAWLRWFGQSWLQVLRFEEMDLFFWAGLALVIGRVDLLLWFILVTQGLGLVALMIYRAIQAVRIDRDIAELSR